MGLTLTDRVAKSATRSWPRTEGWIDREIGGCEFRGRPAWREIPQAAGADWERKLLSHYLTKIACLGGYLARANDPAPGNTVMCADCHASLTSGWVPRRGGNCG